MSILKPCAEPHCNARIPIGTERCPKHARELERTRNDDRRSRGLHTADWRARRTRILERDRHSCRLQLHGCTHLATQVHIRPELNGDHRQATDADCVAACAHCNATESNQRRAAAARTPGGRAILEPPQRPGTGHFPAGSASEPDANDGNGLVFG